MISVTITRDDVWAGAGKFIGGEIVDCPAVLGPDQDASDETYELLSDALAELDDDETTVSVIRPDGAYMATLCRAPHHHG